MKIKIRRHQRPGALGGKARENSIGTRKENEDLRNKRKD
jgi:hypothetical protein